MNMFARFDENPAMTLRVIKETKRYGRTDVGMDGQRKNSIPTTNKVCGGIMKNSHWMAHSPEPKAIDKQSSIYAPFLVYRGL